MDAFQYLSALRLYGVDVLLLAAGVSLFTSLLKKTAFKKVSKKIFVFLPYAFGLIGYCTYRMLVTLSVLPVTQEWAATLQGGFAVGCAATLLYAVYEQFFRTKENEKGGVLTPLLEGIIPEEQIGEVSKILLTGCTAQSQAETALFVKETLSHYDCTLGEFEIEIYCNLVASYLAAVRAQ